MPSGPRRRPPTLTRTSCCSSCRRSPSSARRIAELPKTARVEVPRPDEALRRSFVSARLAALGPGALGLSAGYTVEAMVADAKGLTLRDLDDLLIRCSALCSISSGSTVPRSWPSSTARSRSAGLDRSRSSTPSTRWPMSSGFSALKLRLDRLRRRFRSIPERAPAGITVVGPNGAGKMFILEAFARETDRTIITLGQIRSEWYGKTDVFAEAFSAGLSAFGRILDPGRRSACRLRLDASIGRRTRPRRDWLVT